MSKYPLSNIHDVSRLDQKWKQIKHPSSSLIGIVKINDHVQFTDPWRAGIIFPPVGQVFRSDEVANDILLLWLTKNIRLRLLFIVRFTPRNKWGQILLHASLNKLNRWKMSWRHIDIDDGESKLSFIVLYFSDARTSVCVRHKSFG